MSQSFSERLSEAWYNGAKWPLLFLPLTLLFYLILFIRSAFKPKPVATSVPVIVVGNITAGGTGKSPLVSYLVRYFESRDLRVGVVSRGYGVNIPKNEVREVLSSSKARDVGDEPLMLKRLLGCDIALCPERKRAVAFLQKQGVQIIIADDGLQHYAMYRDLEICVVDGQRGLGNHLLLPAGPLREPAKRLNSVDAVVFNGDNASDVRCDQNVYSTQMSLTPAYFVELSTDTQLSIEAFIERFGAQKIKALAAIGNPQRFFTTLETLGLSVDGHSYPDHYAYTAEDFTQRDGLVVMTEKDAAKCRSIQLENAWFLRVEPELQDKLGDRLYNRLQENARI